MPNPRHLTKAPIAEAVIDIQLNADVGVESLHSLGRELGYPNVEQVTVADIVVNTTKAETAHSVKTYGYKFTSEDKRYVCQFRSNGMTLSRLEPYEDWNRFFAEAARAWRAYTSVAKVKAVTRIAVRNINRLVFPLNEFSENPQKFLNVFCPLPPNLMDSTNVGQWVFRFHLQDKETKMWAFFTQVSKVSTTDLQAGKFSMVLDVDAYYARDLPTNFSELTPLFDQLHQFKNRVFFDAVTEDTLAPLL